MIPLCEQEFDATWRDEEVKPTGVKKFPYEGCDCGFDKNPKLYVHVLKRHCHVAFHWGKFSSDDDAKNIIILDCEDSNCTHVGKCSHSKNRRKMLKDNGFGLMRIIIDSVTGRKVNIPSIISSRILYKASLDEKDVKTLSKLDGVKALAVNGHSSQGEKLEVDYQKNRKTLPQGCYFLVPYNDFPEIDENVAVQDVKFKPFIGHKFYEKTFLGSRTKGTISINHFL